MSNLSFHHQPLTTEEFATDGVPEKETATVLTAGAASQLDVCRCPKCAAPMTARNGANGPYFHCLCIKNERRRMRDERRGESADNMLCLRECDVGCITSFAFQALATERADRQAPLARL